MNISNSQQQHNQKRFVLIYLKDYDNNFANETDSIIKHNELLTEHTRKNESRELQAKYKRRNDVHEHGKQ